MTTQKKVDTVKELTDKVAKAKPRPNNTGNKQKQLEELRRSLKKIDGELVVSKNRLLIRALGDKAKSVETHLKEATAALFAYADEVAPLKEIMKFFKAAGAGKTKAGLLGDQVLSDKDLVKFASLPTRDVLLATLAARLKGPIAGLHYNLSWNLNKLA